MRKSDEDDDEEDDEEEEEIFVCAFDKVLLAIVKLNLADIP